MNEKIREILDFVASEKEYEDLRKLILHKKSTPLPMLVSGFSDGARAAFCARLITDREEKNTPALMLTPSEKEGYKLISALADFGVSAVFYPVRDLTLRNMTASHEFERQRLSALYAVYKNACDCVIATPDALMLYTMPVGFFENTVFSIENGKDYDPDELCVKLTTGGYRRVETVDSEGQYARRGEILDIFSPGKDAPVRIEFWDRSVDRMSYFDLITQRRTDDINSLTVLPVRETQFLPEKRADLAAYVQKCMRKAEGKVRDQLYEEYAAIKDGRDLSCLDKYLPYLYEEKTTLLSYFGNDYLFVVHEYTSVMERAKFFETQLLQDVLDLQKAGAISAPHNEYALSVSYLDSHIRRSRAVLCDAFTTSLRGMELSGIFDLRTKGTPAGSDLLKLLIEDIDNYKRAGYTVFIACDGESARERLAKDLIDNGIAPSAELVLVAAPHVQGFELPGVRFALLNFAKGTAEPAARRKPRGRYSSKVPSEKIASYADLQIGDLVVHANHGIGIYEGIESMCVVGVRRDYVKIRYADDDHLYLPCDQLDMLSKYIGSAEGEGVRLSKMGGTDWKKTKTKVKAATKEMAKELLQLYAARLRKKGFAFSKDDAVSREFADSFEFEETPGQIQAIEEIAKDMESKVPMDRLLCGDVGYGKTEVALRAAFKAVMDGKQVAILVPTTILAMQHYQTILSRMRGFGVRCDMISRFRSAKEQERTLRAAARGEVDILVGTHRMLSKDIRFHDLGLLVVDEEQRFGVMQKEKIKSLAENVDVLTLTATPIPRTLNMAMSGIRDMSVLEEAPNDRLPVQSFVLEYDFGLITEAIRRELRRGGQVFYLCNNINHLPTIAAKLSEAFPDARIEIGNGQMDKDDLSDIWRSLVSGDTDILVCTTIIETGVDVPNANTIIIENADKMGLSQLHQIRGRVGRSSRRAYAYFTYPRDGVLSEVQVKRLDAIRDFTEFGAGFKIAMRDLEIRGAGNLLGAEQSGHLYSVGYELYMKLLNEAILEEKGEKPVENAECTVDLGVDAYIPEDYIAASAARIDAYRKIALIRNEDDMSDVLDELIDRYGDLPASVNNLLQISLIRALGCDCRMTKIERKNGSVLYYVPNPDMKTWTEMTAKHNGAYLVSLAGIPYVQEKLKTPAVAAAVLGTLTEYRQLFADNTCISGENVVQ